MTYSIVARDPDTGELGVAVQSRYFSVGSVVPWAEPGVGAVATQSFVEVSYGPRGLELMRSGHSALEALERLVAEDAGRDIRQVAMVDGAGTVAVHTGARCVGAAGHSVGAGVSAQANMMERDTVWDAMLAAYAAAAGPFSQRLMAALRAAEAEGGDVRGRQSAAILVVSGDAETPSWERRIDLRVEDHPDPLAELERLLLLHEAYDIFGRASELLSAGQAAEAAAELERAHALAPDNDQITFSYGGALAGSGRPLEGREQLERARVANPRWPVFLRRLAAAGMLPDDPAFLDMLMPLERPDAP
jgi:uncharacterized Ntn-hydrolase superfamily protein